MKIKANREYIGEFQIPGDKSITHRAILFNGMAEGKAEISGALLGEDCLSSLSCMQKLGAKAEISGDTILLEGCKKFRSGQTLDCGNSGTTMRLMMGLLAGKHCAAVLTGDASLSKRPMERVAEPLRKLGAKIDTVEGHAPVSVFESDLTGRELDTAVASAQVKSALILAALGAEGETRIYEKLKTRDHTERLLRAMGADIKVEDNTVIIRKSSLHAVSVEVPGDISSAAYFMVLGALCGETLSKNVGINPTRTGIFTVFDRMGVNYTLENIRESGGEPVADVRVKKSRLKPLRLGAEDMPSLIDEVPVISVLCAFADGESVISGAEELKVKESDRIKTTAEMLCSAGVDVQAKSDGFIIRGGKKVRGGKICSYADHRIAMSGAVLLTASEQGGEIEGAECVNISFPGFFELLSREK